MSDSSNRRIQLKMSLQHVSTGLGDPSNPLTGVGLAAVYTPDPAQHDYAYGLSTPSGNLNFNVVPEIAEGLEVGKKYLVDIYLAPGQ